MTDHRRKPEAPSTTPKTPAKPPVKLQYLLWDGTDPEDSVALGVGLEKRFRWQNLLVDSPRTEEFVVKGPPRIFQPDDEGKTGPDFEARFWRGIKEFPRTFFDPVHTNSGSDRPNLLAFSGHGMPGFMFGEHDLLICSSRPVTPAPPGPWQFDRRPVRPSPPFKWDHPSIKIVLLSACRQLQGRPQQFLWSQAMRGSNPVHMILTYRETAPGASTSAWINTRFLRHLFGTTGKDGQPMLDAWKNTHIELQKEHPAPNDKPYSERWAVLCYENCVGDRLDAWTRTGKLESTPDPDKGKILYFDSDNPDGRPVTKPTQDLDCFLTFRGESIPLPPWMFIQTNAQLDLHVQFIDPKESFHDGDEVWVSVVQVRPDFEAHFDIKELILFDVPAADNPLATGLVQPGLLVHTSYREFVADTYRFTVSRGAGFSWVRYDSTFNELTIPIKMGELRNKRHRTCYFMIRVSNLDFPFASVLHLPPREFGIPTVGSGDTRQADLARLIDDLQFSVFLPPDWTPPPGSH